MVFSFSGKTGTPDDVTPSMMSVTARLSKMSCGIEGNTTGQGLTVMTPSEVFPKSSRIL